MASSADGDGARVVLRPQESASLIARLAEDVSVNQDGLKTVAAMIHEATSTKAFSIDNWKLHPLNPKEMNEATVEWIFFVDLLNFSFWSKDYQVEYKGELYTGYYSLCAAVNRALEEGCPITDAAYFSTVSKDELARIFRSNNGSEMPMLTERLNVLHQAGTTLIQKFNGKIVNCIRACEKDAMKLLSFIVDEFPSFRDEAIYKGTRVSFYKRAQILIADLWACFEGKTFGQFDNIDEITIFADYRVPQVLAHFGAIQYSPRLLNCLRKEELLDNDSREVCEIRGLTIHACTLIRDILRKQHGSTLNSILIDYFLWGYRRLHAEEIDSTTPYHRVRCIYY